MADPATIAMMGIMAAGTGMQVAGQLGAADQYSRLADNDTQAVNEQGDLAKEAGFEQGKAIRKEGTQLLHDQTTAVAAGGLVAGTGSALLVENETARNVELDAITSEYEGMKQKKFTDRQAAMIQHDKRLTKQNASKQAIGTVMGSVMQGAKMFAGSGGGGGGGG